jgi:hypothetical protein
MCLIFLPSVANFRRELRRSLHCQPQNAPISVTPTMDILLGLLENSTANKVFVLSSMVASDVASSPFNLVLYIVNYGVFSKWTALLTKLFIASESPVRDVWNSVEGDVKWLLNCDFYGHNISNMASTAENSEEVFALPILKLICNATTSEITKVSVILKMPRYPLIRVHPSTVEYMRIHSFQGFWRFSRKLFCKFGLSSELAYCTVRSRLYFLKWTIEE